MGNLIDKAFGLSRFLRHPLSRVHASDDSCADHPSTNTGLALVHLGAVLAVNKSPARVLILAKVVDHRPLHLRDQQPKLLGSHVIGASVIPLAGVTYCDRLLYFR